jgi:hypothetical protein
MLFALRTFAAAALALYISLVAGLTNPYWAVATVFIVANPLAGSATSKAVYRIIGTVVGGIATVVIVPNLVNEPELLLGALGPRIKGAYLQASPHMPSHTPLEFSHEYVWPEFVCLMRVNDVSHCCFTRVFHMH